MTQDSPPDGDGISIIPPDYSLKKKVGDSVDLRDLFSEEVIMQAQSNIAKHQEEYLKWFAEDLEKLEQVFARLQANPEDVTAKIEQLHIIALSIKSQGGTFGFELASEIARSLYLYLYDFSYSTSQCTVIRKHIDALRVILDLRIGGSGGETGQELLRDMGKLTAKFRKPV